LYLKIRKLALLTLAWVVLIAVLTPALAGLLIRQHVADPLFASLSNADPQPSSGLRIHVTQSTAGWFFSEYDLELSGSILSPDGQQAMLLPVRLSIAHGPVIWHLRSSLFGVAEIQLINLSADNVAQSPHISGSAIVTLNRQLNLQFNAILGFTALAGQHWLDIRMTWPALAKLWPITVPGWPAQLDISIDADARALAAGPAADALRVYQQQNWVRISGARAISHISLGDDLLNINGNQLPLQAFIRVE
jgi:hypothetical protein